MSDFTWEILWISNRRDSPRLGFPPGPPAVEYRISRREPGDGAATSTTPGDTDPPDMVLLDLVRVEAAEALRRIAEYSRGTLAPVLTLGGPSDPSFALEAAVAGAAAALPADPEPRDLGTQILLAMENHRTSRELRRGYAAFGAIFDDLDFGILLASPQGIILRANRALHTTLGYRRSGLAGVRLAALTHPQDHDTLTLFQELASGQRTHYAVRQRFVTPRGRTVWLDLSASRVDEPFLGEPFCILKLVDATREIRTRDRLDESEQHYRTLFERNPVPTFVLSDENLKVLDANPAASANLGYPRRELLRLGPAVLWAQSGEGHSAARELLAAGGDIGPVRVRQRHRDGSMVAGELQAVSIDHRGRPAHLVMVRNVGDSLRLEEALARARQAVTAREVADDLTGALLGLVERLQGGMDQLHPAIESGVGLGRELDRLRAAVDETASLAQRLTGMASPSGAHRPAASGQASVLLVDDDAAVRFFICEMLDMDGYRVVEADSGSAGLSAFAASGPFDLVVADASLSDLSGSDLVRELRRQQPALKALIVSGYLDEALTARGILGRDLPFLAKPFSSDDLRVKVREILASPASGEPAFSAPGHRPPGDAGRR